jgi:hypothetical protein
MSKEKNSLNYIIIVTIISILVTIVLGIFIFCRNINLSKIQNINSVFQTVTTAVSIIIGFSSSFCGILVSLRESRIVKEIKKDQSKKSDLQSTLISSTLVAFVTLVMSINLMIFIQYNNAFIKVLFLFWFCGSIILLALLIKMIIMCTFFATDDGLEKIEKKSD